VCKLHKQLEAACHGVASTHLGGLLLVLGDVSMRGFWVTSADVRQVLIQNE
jgi:hypothetical protein